MTTWDEALPQLPHDLCAAMQHNVALRRWTSLRVGGPAELLLEVASRDTLVEITTFAQRRDLPWLLLGEGSNVCASDAGVRGLTIVNRCRSVNIGESTVVDCGANFMQLSVLAMQAGLSGLEWAIGIPGSVGGALVSNAGAYGGNIVDIVRSVDVVERGERNTVPAQWMEFSYRDSRLRRDASRPAALIAAELELTPCNKRAIREKARDIQAQRISKQPWESSAGSFFKNLHNRALAQSMPELPELMRQRGVVTSAFLIDRCGCKGLRIGGASVSWRHANFIVNSGCATAADIRCLAGEVRRRVFDHFGITLEEEVLYVGEWDEQECGSAVCT